MWPDSRVTVAPVPGPVSAATSQWRRDVPSTIWVASTRRAKSSSAGATASPTTEW